MSNKAALKKLEPRFSPHVSHQILGAAKYISFQRQRSAEELMICMIEIRDKKLFLDFEGDYQSFDEFLASPESPMSQSTFYRKLDFFKKEGPQQFGLMERWGVSARLRRLLTDGDVRFDGDEIYVGDEQIASDASPTIAKQVVERLVKDRMADRKKIEDLEGYKVRYEDLKAKVNEALEEPDYVTAFKQFENSMRVLIAEANDLPGEMKGERGPLDLAAIYLMIEQLCFVFGEPLPWVRGSWNFERPNWREQKDLAYFQSDAIDADNF